MTPHDALMILFFRHLFDSDFDNRVAQLMTYCLPVTRMNMADHKAKVLTGQNQPSYHIFRLGCRWLGLGSCVRVRAVCDG